MRANYDRIMGIDRSKRKVKAMAFSLGRIRAERTDFQASRKEEQKEDESSDSEEESDEMSDESVENMEHL